MQTYIPLNSFSFLLCSLKYYNHLNLNRKKITLQSFVHTVLQHSFNIISEQHQLHHHNKEEQLLSSEGGGVKVSHTVELFPFPVSLNPILVRVAVILVEESILMMMSLPAVDEAQSAVV